MILFQIERAVPNWNVVDAVIRETVDAAVETAKLCTVPPDAWDGYHYELSLLLTDDAQVRELNREHRGKDKPTNVLSFPSEQIEPGGIPPHQLLGDLVFARETCAREAEAQGKAFGDHFRHLLVHGLLHIYGYDHLDDEGADAMEELERRTLARLGIADPYAQMDANPAHRAHHAG